MRGRAGRLVAALMVATAAGGCGGGVSGSAEESYSIGIGEPRSLIPGDAGRDPALRVVDALFTGLVRYAPDTAEPRLAVAESISSDDQRHWTITIEKGWTFHNGEFVTSENFVRAWNATAYGPHGWRNNRLFERIEGYDALNPPATSSAESLTSGGGSGRAGEGQPKPETKKLAGLEIVDDYTFKVTLTEPFSQFPMMLGHPAFSPLPKVAFEDMQEFAEEPIGNGPYEMTESWHQDGSIKLASYEEYTKDYEEYGGEMEPNVENLTFETFPDSRAAYQALQEGNLDIVPSLPASLLAEAEAEFGDHFVYRPGSELTFLGFPDQDERFDDRKLRRAFSLAINREKLVEEFFADARTPASSVIPPAIPGGRPEPCEEWCEYDPERAKKLYEKADGVDGKVTLWFSSDSTDLDWMKSVRSMLEKNLGVTDIVFRKTPPAEYAATLTSGEATGPYLFSWKMTYPSPQNYLQPLFTSDGKGNHSEYSDEDVDRLVKKGNRAESIDVATDYYQRAEEQILADMPVIPLWFADTNAAHSDRVDDVVVDAAGRIRVALVQVN